MKFIEFEMWILLFRQRYRPIFKGLNIGIENGEFLTIESPSGKGKSTLQNLVSGFVKPAGGAISWLTERTLIK